MATLYLIEQNSILRKRGKRLLVCKRPPASRRYSAVLQKDIIRDLPISDVRHVMVFGNVQVTTSALQILLRNGVEMAVFTYSAELLGQLTPPLGKNVPLRIRQFECFSDVSFALRFSRFIVAAKIANAQWLLRSYLANHPGVFSRWELERLHQLERAAAAAENLQSLRGIEGSAGAHYFNLFGRLIRPPYHFTGRSKRPPRDPVNAVLSFGYVIVGAQIQALVDGMGLDPYLGFYHQPRYGRAGLALDLLEEFRHPLVDRLAVLLFNQNILQSEDFYHPPAGGVYLNTSGKRKFFVHYEKLRGEFAPGGAAQPGDAFSHYFQRQIERLIRTIEGREDYRPFRAQQPLL